MRSVAGTMAHAEVARRFGMAGAPQAQACAARAGFFVRIRAKVTAEAIGPCVPARHQPSTHVLTAKVDARDASPVVVFAFGDHRDLAMQDARGKRTARLGPEVLAHLG